MGFPVYSFNVAARKKKDPPPDRWVRVSPNFLIWRGLGLSFLLRRVDGTWQLESPLVTRPLDVPKGPDEDYLAAREAMSQVMYAATCLSMRLQEGLFDLSQESELKKRRPARR